MCVGLTHTGKTTFARKLAKKIPESVTIDNDDISLFVNTQYPHLASSQHNKTRTTYADPNLKLRISKDVFLFALQSGLHIIHASANLGKDVRNYIKRHATKSGYKLITVYFNTPIETIKRRVGSTKKNTKIFVHSKNWQESLRKQIGYAELPPSKHCDYYFEIHSAQEARETISKIQRIIS